MVSEFLPALKKSVVFVVVFLKSQNLSNEIAD